MSECILKVILILLMFLNHFKNTRKMGDPLNFGVQPLLEKCSTKKNELHLSCSWKNQAVLITLRLKQRKSCPAMHFQRPHI